MIKTDEFFNRIKKHYPNDNVEFELIEHDEYKFNPFLVNGYKVFFNQKLLTLRIPETSLDALKHDEQNNPIANELFGLITSEINGQILKQ